MTFFQPIVNTSKIESLENSKYHMKTVAEKILLAVSVEPPNRAETRQRQDAKK